MIFSTKQKLFHKTCVVTGTLCLLCIYKHYSVFVLAVGIAYNSKCADIMTEKYFLSHK